MMKQYIATLALGLILGLGLVNFNAWSEESISLSPTLTIEVNGLVCDFCAQAVTKVFKRQEEVFDVDVNLTDRRIFVWMKDGADIPDEKLTALVTDSGYNVVAINRPQNSGGNAHEE